MGGGEGGGKDLSPGLGRTGAPARSGDSLSRAERVPGETRGGGGEADASTGPGRTGAAARGEDRLPRADRDPVEIDDESSAVSTDVETLESTDFPPADFVAEEADDSVDDADDPADFIGPPELVI